MLLGGWSAGHLARGWAEAGEAVERAHSLSPLALRVLKTIALLGLVRDAHLVASPAILEWALSDASGATPDLTPALDELLERHLIAWSRARGSYRLWEGGDVDVEALLETARAAQSGDVALQAALELCPPPRLLARRHSFLTGTLRGLEAQACGPQELPALLRDTAGLGVFFCLAPDESGAQSALQAAQNYAQPNGDCARERNPARNGA
ncbi:MAG: hypothetical protein KY445_03050 [Armatimonadetes bacterium]|nr:hypothetical protein [Armatimonadota bacterium]